MLNTLSAWIAAQPEPKPSRPEAIRRLVEKGLAGEHVVERPSDAALDHQIAKQETAIAKMPEFSEPSPEAALAAMDKALAKNHLIKMKNARTRRKGAKQS